MCIVHRIGAVKILDSGLLITWDRSRNLLLPHQILALQETIPGLALVLYDPGSMNDLAVM